MIACWILQVGAPEATQYALRQRELRELGVG